MRVFLSSHLTSLIWRKTFSHFIFSLYDTFFRAAQQANGWQQRKKCEEGDHITDDDDAMGRNSRREKVDVKDIKFGKLFSVESSREES